MEVVATAPSFLRIGIPCMSPNRQCQNWRENSHIRRTCSPQVHLGSSAMTPLHHQTKDFVIIRDQWCGLSMTVGLRTRPVWDQKIGLGLDLADLVLCCETRPCHARRHNDLEGHSNFSSTIYSFSILCLEHHYCGDQQWAFTYLKVKSTKSLCLLPVVLVLLFFVLVMSPPKWPILCRVGR